MEQKMKIQKRNIEMRMETKMGEGMGMQGLRRSCRSASFPRSHAIFPFPFPSVAQSHPHLTTTFTFLAVSS